MQHVELNSRKGVRGPFLNKIHLDAVVVGEVVIWGHFPIWTSCKETTSQIKKLSEFYKGFLIRVWFNTELQPCERGCHLPIDIQWMEKLISKMFPKQYDNYHLIFTIVSSHNGIHLVFKNHLRVRIFVMDSILLLPIIEKCLINNNSVEYDIHL